MPTNHTARTRPARRLLLSVFVASLILLAGCAGTTGDATTPTNVDATVTGTDGASATETQTDTVTSTPVENSASLSFTAGAAPKTLNASTNWTIWEEQHVSELIASGGTEFHYSMSVRKGPYEADTRWQQQADVVLQVTNWESGYSFRAMEYRSGNVERFEFYNTPDTRYTKAIVDAGSKTYEQYVKDTDLTDNKSHPIILPTSRYGATGTTWIFEGSGGTARDLTWTYVGRSSMGDRELAQYTLAETGNGDNVVSARLFVGETGIVHKYTATIVNPKLDLVYRYTIVVKDGPTDVPTPEWLDEAVTPTPAN